MSVNKDGGAGSVVYLQGPAVSRPAESTDSQPASNHNRLVLVVDDERQMRRVSDRFLQLLGYRVVQAENAYDGLDLFAARDEEFSAVILDLKMPGKDGWQCLSELRAIRPGIPVVICSAYDPDDKQLRRSNRGVAFLKKPFRMDDLGTVLSNLLDRPGYLPR